MLNFLPGSGHSYAARSVSGVADEKSALDPGAEGLKFPSSWERTVGFSFQDVMLRNGGVHSGPYPWHLLGHPKVCWWYGDQDSSHPARQELPSGPVKGYGVCVTLSSLSCENSKCKKSVLHLTGVAVEDVSILIYECFSFSSFSPWKIGNRKLDLAITGLLSLLRCHFVNKLL